METVADLLLDHPFFEGVDPGAVATLAGCATLVHVETGRYLFRDHEPADAFYLLRHGSIALQLHTPTGEMILDTAHDDEVVGWSWAVPPYRWTFDACATAPTGAIRFDAVCVRDLCARDPALGYALLQRVVQVMARRVHSARVRLLDLYGGRP